MASSSVAAKYIISRYADPVFAISIGVCAALIRLRREESEKRSGVPSASFVISLEQQKRIDAEHENRRARYGDKAIAVEMQRQNLEQASKNSDVIEHDSRSLKPVNVGYSDIFALGWERIKWKLDYEWNGRGKELERHDGKLV